MCIIFLFIVLLCCRCEISINSIDGRFYSSMVVSSTQKTRYFYLIIPPAFRDLGDNENATLPVLVGLHGGGGNAEQFKDESLFADAASNQNWATLFIEGQCGLLVHKLCVWNSGHVAYDPTHQDDVEFIDELLEQLLDKPITGLKNVILDSKNLFFTGHSNGACMSYRMAWESNFDVKAIAPVSGTIAGISSDKSGNVKFVPGVASFKTNILHVHGMLDMNLKPNGGFTEAGFASEDGRYDESMEYSLNYWLGANGCDPDSVTERNITETTDMDGEFVLKEYSECKAYRIQSLTITNGEHMWATMEGQLNNSTKAKTSFCENEDMLSGLIVKMLVKLIDNDYKPPSPSGYGVDKFFSIFVFVSSLVLVLCYV